MVRRRSRTFSVLTLSGSSSQRGRVPQLRQWVRESVSPHRSGAVSVGTVSRVALTTVPLCATSGFTGLADTPSL